MPSNFGIKGVFGDDEQQWEAIFDLVVVRVEFFGSWPRGMPVFTLEH